MHLPSTNTTKMNKLAIVSGGTKGIGRHIADKFLSEGFSVCVSARNKAELDKMEQLTGPGGARFYGFEGDMSKPEVAKKFGAFALQKGTPEILINNAGYFLPGEICTEKEGQLEDMINANLLSAYHLTRAVVAKMKEAKHGHIFNMCSIASIKAYANGGSYAITKFALLGFSKCLREELKPHKVRVTAVMPGATKTASWDGVDLPDERFMKPEDVAEAVWACYTLSTRSVVEEILIRPQLGDI